VRAAAIVLFSTAAAVQAAAAFAAGYPTIGGGALVLALWSTCALTWDSRGRTLPLSVLGHTALAAAAVGTGVAPLPAIVGLTAALYGWDTAVTEHIVAALPAGARRAVTRLYLRRSGIFAVVGVGVAAAAPHFRLRLGFRSGLAVALAALLIAAILVRIGAASSASESTLSTNREDAPGDGSRRPAR